MTPLPRLLLPVAALILLCGCQLQNRLLYFPSPAIPSDAQLSAGGLTFWGATANDYRGLTAAAGGDAPRGTVVVFHGNGGTAGWRGYYARELGKLGLRVILAEYPRYGGRPGELGEAPFVRDAVETVQLAAAQYPGPLYLLGESLGAGVACGVARQMPDTVAGLILVTPWDRLEAVAVRYYPAWLVRLLLDDRYDNVANLAAFRGPVAVLGAESDDVIPMEHAARLFAALTTPRKRLWTISGAGHNNWAPLAPPTLWPEVVALLAAAPGVADRELFREKTE